MTKLMMERLNIIFDPADENFLIQDKKLGCPIVRLGTKFFDGHEKNFNFNNMLIEKILDLIENEYFIYNPEEVKDGEKI